MHNLEMAESESDKDPSNQDKLEVLEESRILANELEKKDAEGACIRARVDWKMLGEKPTKYFCALEKHNNLKKFIPSLKISKNDGTEKIVKKQSDIQAETSLFYKKTL